MPQKANGERGGRRGKERRMKRRKKEGEKRKEEEEVNGVGSLKKEALSIQEILKLFLGVSQGLGTKGESRLLVSNL